MKPGDIIVNDYHYVYLDHIDVMFENGKLIATVIEHICNDNICDEYCCITILAHGFECEYFKRNFRILEIL